MLWCKQTMEERFDAAHCRIFATQAQLLYFIDSHNNNNNNNNNIFLPFAIELPSEADVVEKLSRHTSSASGATTSIFTQPTCATSHESSSCAEKKVGVKRVRPRRQDYSLLYGDVPLSTQQRMFLAATLEGLRCIVDVVEPTQLHVYEIIREDARCHLYLDVERGALADFSALHEEMEVNDDDDDDDDVVVGSTSTCLRIHFTDHNNRRWSYAATPREYQDAVRELRNNTCTSSAPPRMCWLDCPVAANNTRTTNVLLEELLHYCREAYPMLLAPTTSAHTTKNDDEEELPEIIVLRSRPINKNNSNNNVMSDSLIKFSQHYIIKFRHHCFANNREVGHFVRGFVDFLDSRVAQSAELHASLFFHDAPSLANFSTSSSSSSSSPPWLVRRSIIDLGVYSRNRSMRCAGCSKLGKKEVLQMEQHLINGTNIYNNNNNNDDDDDDACGVAIASLISLDRGLMQLTPLPLMAPTSSAATLVPRPLTSSHLVCHTSPSASSSSPLLEAPDVDRILRRLEVVYRERCGVACVLADPKIMDGTHLLLLQVHGTRYCQRIHREHRSNRIFFVVDMQHLTWRQKCFDPECKGYGSTPEPIFDDA